MLPKLPASQAGAKSCETVADRVGWAFASGYQAALRVLVPDLPADRICALCVTEEDGNSPKAIKTTLRRNTSGLIQDGAKRWATLGPEGGLFLVAARDAETASKRPSLKVARVASDADGVRVDESAVLPGDGYDEYVKRFRTVEAIHVQAAILSYLMREAQRLSWPENWIERLSALLAALGKIADMPASEAETHVALAGALAISGGLIGEAEPFWMKSAADPAALRWARDRELLKAAGTAREQRTKRARERLRG